VVGDEHQLLGEQADVQGVQYGAHRGDGEVGGQMLGVVPHERADTLISCDTQAAERVSQLRGVLTQFTVGFAAAL
jgi:hypothetical protein